MLLIATKKNVSKFVPGIDREALSMFDKMRKETSGWAANPQQVDEVMDFADSMLGGSGIEGIEGKWVNRYYQNIVALYVNMGDTYETTILYDTLKQKFYVTSWGDFVEARERAYRIE